MSKRKGSSISIHQKDESPCKSRQTTSLKKARMEVSKYTLLSKSRHHSLTQKEETEQLTAENDMTTEITILLDHLDEKNCKGIEKQLKKVMKADKATKKTNHRFTHACFKLVFSFLLCNDNDLDSTVVNELLNCFKLLKNVNLNEEQLGEYFEVFIDDVIESNKISEMKNNLIMIIAKSTIKTNNPLYHSIFVEIIESGMKLNDHVLLGLIQLLDQLVSQGYKRHDTNDYLLNTVFKIAADDSDEPTDTIGFSSWSIENIADLVKATFKILRSYLPETTGDIVERIIEMITFKSFSLEERAIFRELETKVIQIFVDELSGPDLKKKNHFSEIFCSVFNRFIKRHSIDAILNGFVTLLYTAAIDTVDTYLIDQLHEAYVGKIRDLYEQCIHMKNVTWLEGCSSHKNLPEELMSFFMYRRLRQILTPETIFFSQLKMCWYILDNCIEDQCSELMTDPIKISEYFSVFVIRILTQLIKNHTTDIQMIIMQMFNKCFIQTKQHIYINQLHILLRDKSVNEILWDSRFTSEIEKLRKSIISRFSTYKHTKGGPPTFKNIHQFPSVDTVIQLYDAIEIIIPYAKNEQKNQLIGNLVSNTSNSYCLKVAVSGLLSSLRSLNLSVSQNNSINEKSLEKTKRINEATKSSLTIITALQTLLSKAERNEGDLIIIAELKASIYQTFYRIINLNERLIKQIVTFFTEQINKLLIKKTEAGKKQYHFDLSRCVTDDFQLIEPVDVLYHCAGMCSRFASTKSADSFDLKQIITGVMETYVTNGPKEMFQTYKCQTISKVIKQGEPATSMKVLHQIELGLIDALMEHSIDTENFEYVPKILEHYENASSLISNEIEDLISYVRQPKSSGLKRKLLPIQNNNFDADKRVGSLRSTLKRLKPNKNIDQTEKENVIKPSDSQQSIQSKREPFANISNVNKVAEAKKVEPVSQNLGNFSFANIQFDYVPRISYSCCAKMLQLVQVSNPNGSTNVTELFTNVKIGSSIIAMITNPKLYDYIIKIIDKKLKTLLVATAKDFLHMTLNTYDPEGMNSEQVFKFLSKIWDNSCLRVNGTINQRGDSTFTVSMRTNLNQSFLVKTYKNIIFCQSIWTIVCRRFQSFKPDLIKNERKIYAAEDEDLNDSAKVDSKKKNHKKLCWKFLLNCSKTVKLHTSPTGSNQVYAAKVCSSLLTLMLNILKTTSLTSIEYDNFNHWLSEVSNLSISCEGDVYKSIINLQVFIWNKRSTSAIVLKHLMHDYNEVLKDSMDTIDMSSDDLYMGTQYKLVTAKNSNSYYVFIVEKLTTLVSELDWAIKSTVDFNEKRLLDSLYKQINSVILTISYAIKSVCDISSLNLAVKLMIDFYDLLRNFFSIDIFNKLNPTEIDDLKDLIDDVSCLQTCLAKELPRIKEFILNDQEQREEKANATDVKEMRDYKMLTRMLSAAAELFDENLSNLNKKYRDALFLENYNTKIIDLELNFDSKITRTISLSQVNNIHQNDVLI